MGITSLLSSVGLRHPTSADSLPVYSTLPTTPTGSATASQRDSAESDDGQSSLHTAQPESTKEDIASLRWQLPTLSRFLADYTLGFADGLTVPFALTAGLSSLGEMNTVVYAGLAEICAGSISMGIGGYLSAKSEQQGAVQVDATDQDDEEKNVYASEDEITEQYLAPLQLPTELQSLVLAHLESTPHIQASLAMAAKNAEVDARTCSPILSGMCIALGYLLGGLLPLLPYFFVSQVGDGLRWSFVICTTALFAFGFSKSFLLQEADQSSGDKRPARTKGGNSQWLRLRKSLWDGVQMAVLGTIAALAAVLCVRFFADVVS